MQDKNTDPKSGSTATAPTRTEPGLGSLPDGAWLRGQAISDTEVRHVSSKKDNRPLSIIVTRLLAGDRFAEYSEIHNGHLQEVDERVRHISKGSSVVVQIERASNDGEVLKVGGKLMELN